MSGLFGYVTANLASHPDEVVGGMALSMRHQPHIVWETRSPTPGVALGRIGIGVFNQSPQPARSRDGLVSLWLCGEFYHQDRRRAQYQRLALLADDADDCDLALQTYLNEGANGLTALNGAFVIAVWDGRTEELSIINDRFGLYPHYYAHAAGAFTFAPEIKAVLGAPGLRRDLNLTAVAEYVRFQQILGDKTWLEDISLVPRASHVSYRPHEDQLEIQRYWDWDEIESQTSIGFDDAANETIRLFQRGIDEMTASPHRMGVYLSGGLDGRTILGFTDPEIPVTAITFGAPGCRDVAYATEIARRCARPHRWFPFVDGRWVLEYAPLHLALTEGQHSWMHAHGMSTLSDARTVIDVNLSGWDGGTIMGGLAVSYDDDQTLRAPKSEAAFTAKLYDDFCSQVTWPGLTDSEATAVFKNYGDGTLLGRAFESFQSELACTSHYSRDRRPDYFYIIQHDRRSTANMVVFSRSAFEVRCPFFDYDFVDFVYSLPEHIRASPKLHRAVITRRMARLATVPYEKDDRLPHSNPFIYHGYATLQRAKHWTNRKIRPIFPDRPRLYADYENYLRHELRPWAESILFDSRTEERGLFNPTAVRELWERHLSGRELWTIGKIAPLMTIEMVLRLFIDGDESVIEPRAFNDPATLTARSS